ncbi:MAG: glycoside hydrolase family 127 protein [Clostridia bacterium]|nr:glycoside hydrolase family 127 protein [Clostridia bacterium]
MEHIAIDTVLRTNKMLSPRERTDTLFPLPAGSFGYRGWADEAIRFIEGFQLLDASLWQKFVKVFTEQPGPDTADKGWRGEYWGKMMRGGCITYQYTQNPDLYKLLTATIEDMLNAPEADGRISAYDREAEFDGWDIWCRKYVMLGLEYFLEICTDEALSARILPVLCGEADTLLAAFGKDKKDITKATTHWEGVNSSSVLKPIVRLYHLTGAQKYLDFATYLVERGAADTENLFEKAFEGTEPPHRWKVIKAYEIMSCFEGLLEYYRATGLEKWKTAALNFGRLVCEHEVSIIGCCGCWHELFDGAKTRQVTTVYTGQMQETCVTVTWMKLCLQLLCLSGDPRYADELERSICNALLGAVNFDKSPNNHGLPFDSYSPLVMGTRGRYTGGRKPLSDGSDYGCCAAIGAAGLGLIPTASMLLRRDGLAVNLYIPGIVSTKTPDGAPLEIGIKTDFPQNGSVVLTVDTTDPKPFTLALRIPQWSYRTALAVNGNLVENVNPGTYTELCRVWHCGDTVELFLDMRTEVIRPAEHGLPDENAQYHVALRRGPHILARDSRLHDDLLCPVSIVTDAYGFAEEVLPLETDIPAICALRVKQTDGSYLEVIDYASAGRTWDNRSLMSAWMHTKAYLPFDPTQPFEPVVSCYMASGQLPTADGDGITKTHIALGEDGIFYSPAPEKVVTLQITDLKNGTCHLAFGDRYLAVDREGHLTLSKKGTPFTLCHQGHNCYAIADPEGRYLEYGRSKEPTPLFFAKHSVIPRNLFDFVNV